MNRDEFLTRVAQAARLGNAYRIQVPPRPKNVSYVGVQGDLCDAMAREVNAVGGVAKVVSNHAEAGEKIAVLCKQYSVLSALCWQHPVLNRCELDDLLSRQGITKHCYDSLVKNDWSQRLQAAREADIGISSVDFAIAETGTLIVCAQPGQERMTSLLPPVHIAIVEESQLVPDLLDAIELLRGSDGSLPSNIALITGPSKTGDIELQLTTGVHGPGRWHVVIIRESSG